MAGDVKGASELTVIVRYVSYSFGQDVLDRDKCWLHGILSMNVCRYQTLHLMGQDDDQAHVYMRERSSVLEFSIVVTGSQKRGIQPCTFCQPRHNG